jgi:hypothetical protein
VYPKWAVYVVVGGIDAYYLAKMEGGIEGIWRQSGGSQGVQYSLRATGTASYTCYICGNSSMNLMLGGIWMYGETINPAIRYSQGQLGT